jgi:hypothetical protein
LVAQAARLLRQTDGRQDEEVTLVTSAEPEKLDAQRWLELNRAGFGGIENGLHQRLDVSHNDDRCRIPKQVHWGPLQPHQQQPVHGVAFPPASPRTSDHDRLSGRHGRKPLPPGLAAGAQ